MQKLIKIVSATFLILLISGCSLKDINAPVEPKIDPSLEVINNDSIRTISGINSIAFEWRKVDDIRAVGYNFYRAKLNDEKIKLQHVKLLKNRYSSHYLDNDLEPNTFYVYSMTTANAKDYESKATKSFEVKTLDVPVAIPYIQAVSNLPRQIKILWRPHPNESIKYYKVFRKQPNESDWDRIKTLEGRLQAEFIDEDLDDNIVYLYQVTAYTFEDIASKASQIVQAQTKPLPMGVNNLNASQNLPKKIVLQWEPSSQEGIIRYNLYKNNSLNGSFSLVKDFNTEVLSYEDVIQEDGKVYFYKVSTIDIDGLESSHNINAKMGMTLPKLNKPVLTLAQIQGEKAILNWQSGDNRAANYTVYKKAKIGLFEVEETKYTNIKALRFEDNNIIRGVEYEYSIQSLDQYGIASQKTKETTLILPKLVNN